LISRAIFSALPNNAVGHIEKGLVEGQALHEIRVFPEDREYLARNLPVALEPRPHNDGVRTASEGLAHRHRRVHAEPAHLVAGRGNDATPARAADDHRLAGQLRIVELLDSREERVHVHVQDRAVRGHESDSME
jgi:hypothetical protein